MVWGKATDETVDSDDQIIDRKFASRAMKAWFESWGNENAHDEGCGSDLDADNDENDADEQGEDLSKESEHECGVNEKGRANHSERSENHSERQSEHHSDRHVEQHSEQHHP